ncbi:unnamed protein product [Leptidea sinapis]|uniref:Peptidase A1 domain-containing protein n=1 Tax=Leptidea sinapis TaxID=189913 RepID=A0A5E4Q2A0_9NEOP|nr:unnamed protein product [Leptidea sinapis]
MVFVVLIVIQTILFLNRAICDEFNLSGEAGQAYALEVHVGHPPQKLNVLVDTGSATLAIASYPRKENDIYFHTASSSSLINSGKQVQAKYSQGNWSGHLASDFISFPSLYLVPEVRSDIALITKSHKFFMNGSGWQGLLGLAYLPVAAWGDNAVVGPWLDFVDKIQKKPMSFLLKLCGTQSQTNATHYGSFKMFGDDNVKPDNNFVFRTPILRKRWYEVGVLSVRLLNYTNTKKDVINNMEKDRNDTHGVSNIDVESCRELNSEKSIVDSGTTSITLPNKIFRQNFMRVVTANNNSGGTGTVSEFCYKLGLEASGKETVLFNRSAGWIGWKESDCGSNARVTGPYNASTSLLLVCSLTKPLPDVNVSIKAAQWTLCVISIVAAAVLVYLLAPCVKMFLIKPLPIAQQISLSQAALVEQENA